MKSTSSNLPNCNVWYRIKVLKCGTNSAWFANFWGGIWKYDSHWICVVAKLVQKKTIVKKKLWEKRKFLNFGPKMPYLGNLGSNLKAILSYLTSTPRICLIAKFYDKTKMAKFGTKNAWFAYFGAGLWKYCCHIWNQRPRICLVPKFVAKIKTFKFGTKNAWFGYFWTEIWNNIVIFEISNFEFVQVQNFGGKKMPKFGTKNPFFEYF